MNNKTNTLWIKELSLTGHSKGLMGVGYCGHADKVQLFPFNIKYYNYNNDE